MKQNEKIIKYPEQTKNTAIKASIQKWKLLKKYKSLNL